MYNLITIVGPTAVGKTDLTLDLAGELETEIISGDAYQIYRDLNIGTAKPSDEELAGIRHHLINILTPDADYSVSQFKAQAEVLIAKINESHKIPILSGGTGLYVQALIEGYHLSDTAKDSYLRQQLDDLLAREGMEGLLSYAQKLAAEKGVSLQFTDKHRLYRTVELLLADNVEALKTQSKDGLRYNGPVIGLRRERNELYERINYRVDLMVEAGLFEEVAALLDCGVKPSCQAFRGIGYKEVIAYFEGAYDKARCIELIKQNTRHFAKRQLTWYRRMPYIHWLDMDKGTSKAEILAQAKAVIKQYYPDLFI